MKQYQERIQELESSLGDCETLASHMHQEKEKWKRQCEKSEKVSEQKDGRKGVTDLPFLLARI